MSNKVVRIPSRLYYQLFERGGDKLIAVYCNLKSIKKGFGFKSFTSKNNKKVEGLSLIRYNSNISLKTIEKYIPMLLELGVVSIQFNGDVRFLGNNALKKIYSAPETLINSKTGKVFKNRNAGKVKLVPILIGDKIKDTALNAVSVRVFSAERRQKTLIKTKKNQSEVLSHKFAPENHKDYKKALRLSKRLIKETGTDKISFTEKTILSNQGYAKLKDQSENNKSKGAYWKRKLKERGLIETSRRFAPIMKMSLKDYLAYKKSGVKQKNEVFCNGYLVEEKISSFSPINNIPIYNSPNTQTIKTNAMS